MHKIDKHTGLYLEWGGPYLTPVSEMRETMNRSDASLDELANEIYNFLLTKKDAYAEIIKNRVIENHTSENDYGTRLYMHKMSIKESVFTYPTVWLSTLESEYGYVSLV